MEHDVICLEAGDLLLVLVVNIGKNGVFAL